MGMRGAFRDLTEEGSTITIIGSRKGGKSWLTTVLIDWWLKEWNGTKMVEGISVTYEAYVLSNLMFMRKDSKDPLGWVEAYPRHVTKTTTFAKLFLTTSEIVTDCQKRNVVSKILWVIDEGGQAFSSAQHWMSKKAATLSKFLGIQRKFGWGDDGGMTSIFVAVDESMILSKLRAENKSIIRASFSKDPGDLSKYAGHLLRSGYDRKQIAILKWPEWGEEGIIPIVVEESKHAKRKNDVKEGEIVYSNKSSADFDIGAHPVTRQPFNADELFGIIGGVIDPKVPALLYRYMHENPDNIPEVREWRLSSSTAKKGAPKGEQGPPQIEIPAEEMVPRMLRLLESGASNEEITVEVACDPSWTRKVRRKWESGGYEKKAESVELETEDAEKE